MRSFSDRREQIASPRSIRGIPINISQHEKNTMNFDPYSSKLPASGPSDGTDKLDPKLVTFAQNQVKTMQVFQMLEKVTELCWDLCDVSPKDRIDGRTEKCLQNCSGRYQDTAQFIMTRFASKAQGQ